MKTTNTNRIRGIMAEKRITGTELARLTGFTQTTISTFLNGGTPTFELVKAIVKALDLDPGDIIQIFF